jgi:hypothetical protein
MAFVDLLFYLNLALLLAHELDAVRRQEWRMFAFLNRLDDERAHQLFTLLHVPLFILIFWFLSRPPQPIYFWFQLVIDIFLVIHLGLHLLFRNHPANAFDNPFSMGLIAGMALLGLVHAGLLLGGA